MNYFKYKLLSPSGKVSKGTVRLPYQDVMSAVSHLERDGSMAIFVKKADILFSSFLKLSSFSFKSKMSRASQAELLSNMALMLRSGMPISTALQESAGSADLNEISTDIEDMISAIKSGMSLSETAAKYRYIFPKTILHLIRIGEETGNLDEMLKEGADHLKRIETIVSDTKQALMYPSFVFVALGAGMVFWFYFVVPKIIGLFQEMDVVLPPLTIFLVKVSEFVQSYFLHILVGLCIVIPVIVTAYKGNKSFKKSLDFVLLKLPVVGSIISASTLAFITEYLALLLRSGLDILRSMSILKESISNEIYKEKLGEILESIKRGEEIASSFSNTEIFPSFFTRMIRIGETSGTMTEQLTYIADEYKSKLTILVSTIGKAIEPLVLVIAGLMFAIIIGGLLLPIYDLVGQISG